MLHLSLGSLQTDLPTVITTAIVLAILVHLVPYLVDFHRLRSYPGPLVAKFSDVWLAYASYQGRRSEVIHDLHKKYGKYILTSFRVFQELILSPKVPSSAWRLTTFP